MYKYDTHEDVIHSSGLSVIKTASSNYGSGVDMVNMILLKIAVNEQHFSNMASYWLAAQLPANQKRC